MNRTADDFDRVAEALDALRVEVARLNDRIQTLEAAAVAGPPVPPPDPMPIAERLDDELLTVIGAAVAAFLGKKAHVRQIRLIGTTAWSMQGRVTIQASHSIVSNPEGSRR